MTLLEPNATVTALAITLPPLLLLYLLKLRRRPLRISSTLFWQSASHDLQANIPFRWLRPSWLLFLHLIILGLLVTALGRPVIAPSGPSARRIVLLLDRSASMAAGEGPEHKSRLDAAKAAATEIIDRTFDSAGATVSLVTIAAEAHAEVGFTTQRSALLDALTSTTQTDQPADLAGALKLVEALLAGDQDESLSAATVVLLSDGSFEPGPLSLGGARLSFLRIGPSSLSPDGPDNLGIVALAARRDYDDPATVRIFVRLQNASRSARSAGLSLSLDNTVVDRRAIAVPGSTAAATEPDTAPAPIPGEASTTFELKSPAGGVATITIDRPDLLACDNSASVYLPAARRPRIVLVTPDPGKEPKPATPDQISADSLLADAVAELDSASFTRFDRSQYETIAESGRPAAADLYIFDRVRPSILPAAPSLSFGAPVPIPGLDVTSAPLSSPNSEGAGTYILSWLRTHPALRDVAMDSVFVTSPSRMAWPAKPGIPSPTVLELATGSSGPLIVQVQDGPFRRLVVGFEIAHSNWPLQVGFPIFLAAASDFLTMRAEDSAGQSFTTAQPVELFPPERTDRFELRGPITIPVSIPPPTPGRLAGDVTPIPVGRLERSGVYKAEPPGPQPYIAVNLCNSTETSLATRETVEVGGRAVAAGGSADVSREIWPWFVLAASALLMLEWLVYAWRMRV